jgi:hypothetical protein
LHAKIAACASCCKRLLSSDGQEEIVEMNINALPSTFLLTDIQIQKNYNIAAQYCQKPRSGGSAQWPLLSSEPRTGL